MIKFLSALLVAVPAAAQEYIISDGPLSDENFYRLVSCAARPNSACAAPLVYWQKSVVKVTFAPVPPAYPAALAQEFSDSLDRSISQINGAAPGLNVQRVSKSQDADILLYLQAIRTGDAISGTRYPDLNGVPIGAAQVQIFWDDQHAITDAAIVFAGDIPVDQAGPIMLEELTQSMGLMTDIRNPYYETRSVFSEDSNSVQKLGPQDRAALALHYPAQ